MRHGTRYYSQKVLAVVDQGAVVTVSIAPLATGVASLLYDPERFKDINGYRVSDGERAVTFVACAKGKALIGPPNNATHFPGGFIVAGPRCVPLEGDRVLPAPHPSDPLVRDRRVVAGWLTASPPLRKENGQGPELWLRCRRR